MANTTTNISTNTFSGGLVKDLNASFSKPNSYSHARNMVKSTHDGNLGTRSNEPSNFESVKVTYPYIIGAFQVYDEVWAIFNTDDGFSEIGLYNTLTDKYEPLVNDAALNFKSTHLITGTSRLTYDGTYSIYWDDGLNPTRTLNLENIPYTNGKLDIDKIRLSTLTSCPTLGLKKSSTAGTMPNGSYQVVVAYTTNQIRVTDYFTPSEVQGLWSHNNGQGSLEVTISNLDTNYDEFELVLISYINNKPIAYKQGNYSTHINSIFIGNYDTTLPVVPLEYIPLQTPDYERSNALYDVNGYLLRVGPKSSPDYNYQPLANKINAKWVATQVSSDYYKKGGNVTSYMADENYTFFIRWISKTGKKGASYVIPGRIRLNSDFSNEMGLDAYEYYNKDNYGLIPVWKAENTATIESISPYSIPEGTVVAEGLMGYCETETNYPDEWEDIGGTPVRLHKFPDRAKVAITKDEGKTINILGVKFDNIQHPLDFYGNPVKDIVGYEILRGNRHGNKTVIAKGIFNNTFNYDIPNSDTKGIIPNYPFNDLRKDPYLVTTFKGTTSLSSYNRNIFTFHSPDTNFGDPYLSASEVKLDGEVYGAVKGRFKKVDKHPFHKLLEDKALYASGVFGLAAGLLAIKGEKTVITESGGEMAQGASGVLGKASSIINAIGGTGALSAVGTIIGGPIGGLAGSVAGKVLGGTIGKIFGFGGGDDEHPKYPVTEQKQGALQELPAPFQDIANTFLLTMFLGEGMDTALEIIHKLLPYRQFAYQYTGHAFYNKFSPAAKGNRRRSIDSAEYLEPQLQQFGDARVNNLFRSRSVILKVNNEFANPSNQDNSRNTIGGLNMYSNPEGTFEKQSSCYYGALKVNNPSQYGDLSGVIQVPIHSGTISTEADKAKRYTSPVLFGGDIYINRYTEKNTQFFFNDWLHGQPNGTEFNYSLHQNLPYVKYWINTEKYDDSEIIQAFSTAAGGSLVGSSVGKAIGSALFGNIGSTVGSIIGQAAGVGLSMNQFKNAAKPDDYYNLDIYSGANNKSFGIKKGYFYLFNSGVRDFFVESEINLANRDYEDNKRFYDEKSYTDLDQLFHSDHIKDGNFYKYDNSLSISNLLSQYISWGKLLPRDYDPAKEAKRNAYYPNRVIYSLPQSEENKKDNWRAFLANNRHDFDSELVSIKSAGNSGAIFFFYDASPQLFRGVDDLRLGNGTKITIGDGGLFHAPLQSVSNADASFEYGSCQSRFSTISTPFGVYFISQNQGKVFEFEGGIREISLVGNKHWFSNYLPSFLLRDFPEYDLDNNVVSGVGTITSFDNTTQTIYFSKVDYSLLPQFRGKVAYIGSNTFQDKSTLKKFKLGDTRYFEDASWTVSYDPLEKVFISFHDWIPEITLSTRSHIVTSKYGSLWKHNSLNTSFCNFYDSNYPFEIEFPVSTGQEVTTLRSVEYGLEAYKYYNEGRDKFHVYDQNFDRAVISNSEQCSGMLNLSIQPKNLPTLYEDLRSTTIGGFNIFYSNVENKIRFNTFFDIQRDRGEYVKYEFQPLWNVSPKGYIKELNPLSLDYTKNILQRKKFRHNSNSVFLRKQVSGELNFILKWFNTKNAKSFR